MPSNTKSALSTEDLISASNFERVVDVQWLDGKSPSVVVQINRPSDKPTLAIIDIGNGKLREIATGRAPHVGKDGEWIYFADANERVCRIKVCEEPTCSPVSTGIDGADPFLVGSAPVVFAVDELRQVAFFARTSITMTERPAPGVTVTVTRPQKTCANTDLYSFDFRSKVQKHLGTFPHSATGLAYAAANDSIILGLGYVDTNNSRAMERGSLVAVPLDTLEPRLITAAADPQRVKFATDLPGTQIVARMNRGGLSFPAQPELSVWSSEGLRHLPLDLWVSDIRWSADGRIYVVAKGPQDPLSEQIYVVGSRGEARKLTSALGRYIGPAVSPDGKRIVYVRYGVNGEASLIELRDSRERIILTFRSPPTGVNMGAVERVEYRSFDGAPLSGLLIRPVGIAECQKVPTIVEVHGGPSGGGSLTGQILLSTPLEWHYWASRGYAVFIPEYRGSGVWGWHDVDQWRTSKHQFERDAADVLAGVTALRQSGVADEQQIAILGFSHGAALTNWIVTHDQQFSVGVSLEGWAENKFAYGSGRHVGGNSSMNWLFEGPPWENEKAYEENDATRAVKGVKTPMMFITAQKGIPSYHNEYLYTAWARQGIPTELLQYAGEDHVISGKENRRDLIERIEVWIARYIDSRSRPLGSAAQ